MIHSTRRPPYDVAPWVVAAVALLACAFIFVMSRMGREDWLMKAGASMADDIA
jgi:hypothetical protein